MLPIQQEKKKDIVKLNKVFLKWESSEHKKKEKEK